MTGFREIAGDQAYVVAPLLLVAATTKFLASSAEIDRTGLAELLRRFGGQRAMRGVRGVWVGIASVELGLATLLLAHVRPVVVAGVSAAVAGMLVVYVAWILRTQRASSCGCFGTATPASWRSLVRAVLLTAMLGVYALSGPVVRTAFSSRAIVAMGVELAAVVVLSSELRPWLRRARLASARLVRSFGVATSDVGAVRRRIERQPFWQELVQNARSTPDFRSAWRDGRWYVVEYSLVWEGSALVVVGAEYLGVHPPWVRIVMGRDGDQHDFTVVAAWDSVASAQVAAISRQAPGPSGLELVAGSA